MNRRIWRRIAIGILALFAVATALPWILTSISNSTYKNGDYHSAANILTAAEFTSFYERDSILFNKGTALYKAKDYEAAATTFERASAIASDQNICPITYNWGYTLYEWGVNFESTASAEALIRYGAALRVIAVRRCTEDPAYRDNFEALRQELLKRIAQLLAAANQDQPQQDQTDNSKPADDVLKENETEQKQARRYQDNKNYYESGNSNNNSPNVFTW